MKIVHLPEVDRAGRAMTRLGIVLMGGALAAVAWGHVHGCRARVGFSWEALAFAAGLVFFMETFIPALALRRIGRPVAMKSAILGMSLEDALVMTQARLTELGFAVDEPVRVSGGLVNLRAVRRARGRPVLCVDSAPHQMEVTLAGDRDRVQIVAFWTELTAAIDTGEWEWGERLLAALAGSRDELRLPRTVAWGATLPLNWACIGTALLVFGRAPEWVGASFVLATAGVLVPGLLGGPRRRVFYLRFWLMALVVTAAAATLAV